MMRILLLLTLLFVCARSVAQTTVISKGEIRLGIEVYDYENDRPIDISKICDGFNDEGLPVNMVMPNKSSISLWLPDIDSLKAEEYRYAYDGTPRKIENFNKSNEGRSVAFFGSKSYSGGASGRLEVVKLPSNGIITNTSPQLYFEWQVDYGQMSLEVFIQNDEIDERQQYSDSIMSKLFSNDQVVKSYDYWLEKGFAKRLDENGLPENPIIPMDAGLISFATNAPDVMLTKDGERVDFFRYEPRPYDEGAIYYFKPDDSGSYLLRLTDPRKRYGQTARTYTFTVPFNFWKEGGYWILAAFVATLILFLLFRRASIKRLNESNLLKQLSDAELKAIRSQLNPHFLFNALSAIQNLINQSKNELANDYIVKLSKLLRRVLVQSDESLHSLQEELELAELYLELEKLRIPFDYHIKVDQSIDQNVLMPTMILQPYLENAVFHGVSKFKADQISLEISEIDNQIICKLKDNAKHEGNFFSEGKGMSMGRERIDILKKQLGDKINAEIRTSKGSNGFEVEIRLPLNL